MGQRRWLTRTGVAALLLSGPVLMGAAAPAPAGTPQVIEIHAKKFAYVPDQITLVKGETYKLHLTSDDVPHSLRIKQLGLNAPMKPNQFDDVLFTPEQTGNFHADCGIYCGTGHRTMEMTVHVVDKAAH